MAKSFFETISTAGGLAGEYEALTEAEIAVAPGAAYSPPEADKVFRVVAARTVQLMGGAPIYIESFQTSTFTLRVPKGSDGAGDENDAQDGRLFFIKNSGTGDITLQAYDGTSIGTISPLIISVVLHGDNDAWDLSSIEDTRLLTHRYSSTGGVPGAGTRFLQAGTVATSSVGDQLPMATTLVGASIRVDVIDASRSYNLQILSSPSGVATVLATLVLPVSTISVVNFSLSVSISSNVELGARLVLATGAGASTFSNIIVNVFLEE